MEANPLEFGAYRSEPAMRICFVLEASGGGAGRHVLDLSRALVARKHEIHLLYSPVRAEPIFLDALREINVKLSQITINRGIGLTDLASAWALRGLLKRLGPFDIVHAHSSKAGAVLRLAPGSSGKIVYTPHAFRSLDPTAFALTRAMFGAAEFILSLRTDAIILVSRDEYDHARRLGIPKRKLYIVRNAITRLAARDRGAVREELGLPDDAVVVGYIGRLSHQKAPETFVEVMDQVMSIHRNVIAVMVGDGDLQAAVAAGIARSRFAGRFRQLGAKPSSDYIRGFDLLLMTSRYEAMSYVMLEALAARLPLITTPVAGASDVVEQGGNGIVTASHDVGEIARAVGGIVGDCHRLSQMSERAAAQDQAVNGDRMVVETERLYRTLLGRS